MSLFVVATPIGNPSDLSVRAREILASADLVIGEELKELRQILKAAGVQGKSLDQLNEHSRPADIEHFVAEARDKIIALVSDCGTPGFCDPGADLVDACYRAGIEVQPVPGPSSLMAFLSICGLRLDRFLFFGFLPAKNDLREKAWSEIKRQTVPVVVMETPYRSGRLCEDIRAQVSQRYCVLATDLTQNSQRVLRGLGSEMIRQKLDDAEPIAVIMPASFNGK